VLASISTLAPVQTSRGVAIGLLSLRVQFPTTDEGEYLSTTTCSSNAYEYCSPCGNVVVVYTSVRES
jgi:hypothetical protein